MHWPDIFFKARKTPQDAELPPPFPTPAESAKAPASEPKPPSIKPLPAGLAPQAAPLSTPQPMIQATPKPVVVKIASPDNTSTRTLPAMHGVILRPPARVAAPPAVPPRLPAPPAEPVPAATPVKSIEQLMVEADPVRTLSQTGSVRLLKRLAPEAEEGTPPSPAPAETNGSTVPAESGSSGTATLEQKPDSPPAAAPAPVQETDRSDSSPAPQAVAPAESAKEPAPSLQPPLMPFGSIFRRKAKMTDVARLVLPPKRDDGESSSAPAPAEPSSTVVPPAFPVAAMTARASQPKVENPAPVKTPVSAALESPILTKTVHEEKPAPPEPVPEPAKDAAPASQESFLPSETKTSAPSTENVRQPEAASSAAAPVADQKPVAPWPDEPKVDPEAHRPAPSATPVPKVDPEAHKPEPSPAPPAKPDADAEKAKPSALSVPLVNLDASAVQPEKREFHLANGERVAGTVLSETPEAIYVDHSTLGVLTIPRAQIAKRLVEIILINGDRIVGDIMAETADTLYVRHASLGMLTVPRAHRSTRVVEAILKNGDRILGEVLTETETFTVIRSATLGTVTVPHDKVSLLNRKIEQIELKALPPPAPELKDKPAD
jgi:RNase P/RNase MRP subunit p29